MTLQEFQAAVDSKTKPLGLSDALEALWEDAVGNWEGSHDIAQKPTTENGDRIHAYLHRKEGDEFNAGYWYRRCGVDMPNITFDEEWVLLVLELLEK